MRDVLKIPAAIVVSAVVTTGAHAFIAGKWKGEIETRVFSLETERVRSAEDHDLLLRTDERLKHIDEQLDRIELMIRGLAK